MRLVKKGTKNINLDNCKVGSLIMFGDNDKKVEVVLEKKAANWLTHYKLGTHWYVLEYDIKYLTNLMAKQKRLNRVFIPSSDTDKEMLTKLIRTKLLQEGNW